MSDLAAAINSIASVGLESYAVSQGEAVNVSTVGGISTTSVGSVLSGSSGTLVIIALLIVAGIVLVKIL
jgi:hypothetical protein